MIIMFHCDPENWFRSKLISQHSKKMGHRVIWSDYGYLDCDMLVIDMAVSQLDFMKSVSYSYLTVIDGSEIDTIYSDLSISAWANRHAQFMGLKYIVVPELKIPRYNGHKSKTMFISVGEMDVYGIVEKALPLLHRAGYFAIVDPSCNHYGLRNRFKNVGVFDGNDVYDAMSECFAAITDGGNCFLQSLHYGLPTVAVPQKSQKKIVNLLSNCCIKSFEGAGLGLPLEQLRENSYLRDKLSLAGQLTIDGQGAMRISRMMESITT